MSTTTDGLLLRENAPISDSSDDTRGPDAAPTDNLHGNILDASQEVSDEESCASATGTTTLSEGDVTTTGSDRLPTCTAAGESGGVEKDRRTSWTVLHAWAQVGIHRGAIARLTASARNSALPVSLPQPVRGLSLIHI